VSRSQLCLLPLRLLIHTHDSTPSQGRGWVYVSPGCFAHPEPRAIWLGGVCKGGCPRAGGHRVSRRCRQTITPPVRGARTTQVLSQVRNTIPVFYGIFVSPPDKRAETAPLRTASHTLPTISHHWPHPSQTLPTTSRSFPHPFHSFSPLGPPFPPPLHCLSS